MESGRGVGSRSKSRPSGCCATAGRKLEKVQGRQSPVSNEKSYYFCSSYSVGDPRKRERGIPIHLGQVLIRYTNYHRQRYDRRSMMQTPITIPIMIESLRRLVRIIDTMLLMPGMVSTTIRNRDVASHEKNSLITWPIRLFIPDNVLL